MRQDYDDFVSRNAEVLAISPDKPGRMAEYWTEHRLPFPAIADPGKVLLEPLGQRFRLLRFGRLPVVLIISIDGDLHYAHYGDHAADIPDNTELLRSIDDLQRHQAAD